LTNKRHSIDGDCETRIATSSGHCTPRAARRSRLKLRRIIGRSKAFQIEESSPSYLYLAVGFNADSVIGRIVKALLTTKVPPGRLDGDVTE
jgi:hypothetical protein